MLCNEDRAFLKALTDYCHEDSHDFLFDLIIYLHHELHTYQHLSV